MSNIEIVFRIVDVDSEDSNNLQSEDYLKLFVQNTVDRHNGKHPPFYKNNENVSRDIFKYLKLQDQWICFGSTLLKSLLFHETRMAEADSHFRNTFLPITSLPRSKHGKPFLPTTNRQVKFNVSHQYPFIGIAMFDPKKYDGIEIGLDIVNFEDYQKQSISEDEYLSYYKDMFTPFEWHQILGDSGCNYGGAHKYKMLNFYTRWAVKEAISKAKGLGLSMDFSTFQITIEGFDDDTTTHSKENPSIGDLIYTPNQKSVLGKLEKLGEPVEYWLLSFTSVSSAATPYDVLGCACISVGPFSEKPEIMLSIIHQSFSFMDLISAHTIDVK